MEVGSFAGKISVHLVRESHNLITVG